MKKIILTMLSIILLYTNIFATNGTYGVTGELKENAYSASFNDNYSFFLNPAKLTDIDQTNIVLYMAPKVMGYSNLIMSTVQVPLFLHHTVGVGILKSGVGDIELVKGDGSANGFGNLDENGVYLSYSWKVLPFLSVGANVAALNKKATDNIFTSNWSVGTDLGVVFNPFNIYNRGYSFVQRGKLDVGLTVKNAYFLPLKNSYDNGESIENIPMNLIASLHYGWRRLFDFSTSVLVNDLMWSKNEDFQGNTKKITQNVNADLRVQVHPMVGVKAGWVNDGIKGGLDFSYKRLNLFRYIELGYDLVYKPTGHIFVNNIKMVTKVGPTREEMNARRLFDMLKMAPNDLYERALAQYKQKKYWEASWLFSELVTKYPRFYLVDAATYYLGSSYEKLEMNDLAREVYNGGLNQYKTSEYQAYYLYGLQNLDYKAGNYDGAKTKFQKLIDKYSTSPIFSSALYVDGQVKFSEGKLDEAYQQYSKVDKLSDAYLYAQYSMAVINAIRGSYDNAINNLTVVLTAIPADNAQKQLQNKGHILAGHIIQEMKDVKKIKEAIGHYTAVTPDSPNYDEALLGVSWVLLRAQKPDKAMIEIEKLISNYPKSRFRAEALLLRGYANQMMNNFAEAVDDYKSAVKMANSMEVDEKSLKDKQVKHKEVIGKFLEYQDKIKNIALKRADVRTPEKKLALKNEYDEYINEINDYSQFLKEIEDLKKFSLSREKIINDADYAKGNALVALQKQEKEKAIQKTQQKTQEDQQKIKEIEEQLKMLENE